MGKAYLPAEEVEQRVALQVTRQQILARSNPARLWVVIDESVLRRPVGGEDIMRAQIEHLMKWAQQPNITLQIMPFSSVGYPGAGGAFSILRFPEGDLPDIVYIEHAASALYLDKLEEVDEYVAIMEALTIAAAPVSQTESLLKEALAGWTEPLGRVRFPGACRSGREAQATLRSTLIRAPGWRWSTGRPRAPWPPAPRRRRGRRRAGSPRARPPGRSRRRR